MPITKSKKELVTTETFKEEPRHGWNSEEGVCKFIGQLAAMTKVRTAIEVGVFEGETSKRIIEALPAGGQFIGIDINDYRTPEAIKAYSTPGIAIDFFHGNSLDVAQLLPNNHFDMIFIDGDHSWEHVIKEFKSYEPKLSRNGFFVYHDTIHLEGCRKIVEYAMHWGYKSVTLNTPEGRGLSILHR